MGYSEPGQVEAGSPKESELAPEQPIESDEVHVVSSSGRCGPRYRTKEWLALS
jgi:hypothetical protein